ncbi:hypothetical protein DPMN_172202 [Dreissena polymorpha]|uniref:NACHT domain-containing protein n=1 Tax=Dreissena polymorpha TaxID=45954 RepID=A0A9D4DZE5_DREPO|nr:hypothetical protein DPMN_172202 [Dreissena polymorpha]
MGKSTFLTKLALDWCEAALLHNPQHKTTFSDVDTLYEFPFLFHISLRDAIGQREVIKMIKTQIIDNIYTGATRKMTFELLQQILERETCILSMDGLNEWADPLNKCTVPVMANCYTKCVSLITARPWKMADERIKDSEIDRLIEIEGITDPETLTKLMILSLQPAYQKKHTEFTEYVNARQLMQFFKSPWMQTLLASLWMNNKDCNGSLCELYCIVLDLLFKKANAREGYFKKGTTFKCLSNTSYIEPQNEILNGIAKAAFHFTFSSEKSLVFSKAELRNFMSEDQLKFCLNAGLLTVLCNSTEPFHSQPMSFPHETVQEFLAALHIANSKTDVIESLVIKNTNNVLQMSQIIIYLCGLDCGIANKLIHRLTDGDFFNDINHALSEYIVYFQSVNLEAFNTDHKAIENIRKSIDGMDYYSRILAVSFLFQRMMIACLIEAKASGQMDICLKCRDFVFNTYLSESESNALRSLLMFNKSNVRTLILESNLLQKSELLTVLQQSKHCLERVKAKVIPEIHQAFHDSNLQELHMIGRLNDSIISDVLTSLSKLTYLYIEDSTCNKEIHIPFTIKNIELKKITCSAVFLQMLLVHLSSLKHDTVVHFDMCDVNLTECNTSISQALPIDMSNIEVFITQSSIEMYGLLRCAPIVHLTLLTAVDAELASDILLPHSKLETLYLWGTYLGHCALQLPASLHCVSLQTGECSSEWLCSLLIKLSELDHPVECQLWNFEVQTLEKDCGADSNIHVSDLRCKLLSCDMSNIEILVKNGIKELFEIFRDTSIRILNLRNAGCVSHTSDILPTLSKLEELQLWGTYTGHCDLQLPASLHCISLQTGECSSEWLCSLLIKLSELDHPVECELWDFVVQSRGEDCGTDSNIPLSDLRSKLLSCDMSNIEILVHNGIKELFEIFRDTSIGILDVINADCVLQTSEILPTLSKLERLLLWGTYTGHCYLQLPASLHCVGLQTGECSSEWLCSLLIKLSELDHPVKCELFNFVVQSRGEDCGTDSNIPVSDLRSKLLSCDMSNIEILVHNGIKELFEIFRDTSIGILNLRNADCVSHTSDILPTLSKLEKLYLWGTYTGHCALQLPASLNCISLQTGGCSSEWLCSLLIKLTELDHPVKCELWNFVVLSRGEDCGTESNIPVSDLRSKLLSCDMSDIEISITHGIKEQFEIFRDTSIVILALRNADCLLQTSGILPTLSKLEKLYLWGTYTGHCALQLPASLNCISLQRGECSSEWLCSLLIKLSELDHPVKCQLWNVVVQSRGEDCGTNSTMHVSDMRSKLLSCDMSNIEILVHNGNKELFEIFRDTSIGILNLRNADCVSHTSDILPTLSKLEKLYLWGTYTGHCALQLPASLNCISLQTGGCSSEWLCSLLIKLTELDHPVKCELWNFVVLSRGEDCGTESNIPVSDLRSKLLSCDMSDIEISITHGIKEQFEIFRDTSIVILALRNQAFYPHSVN